MSQILTYPWNAKYSTSSTDVFRSQVKDGKDGSLPINNEITRGGEQQNTGGINWYGDSSVGSDNVSDAVAGNYAFEQNSDGRGMRYWMSTSKNGYQTADWFDFGADPKRADGETLNYNARSSWLSQVTGVWFLFNSKDTRETRDCYSRVEHVALRFVEEDTRKIRIRKVTEKIGNYTYMNGHRGQSKLIFGYQLDAAGRLEVSEKKFKLLGVRVQFQLRRGAGGTTTDTVQAGLDAMRFSLGDASSNSLTSNTMRALCGKGNTTWSQWESDWPKLELEGRP